MNRVEDEEITLEPSAGFVVKTQIVSGKRQGLKTFVNVCSDSRVPEPADGYGPEILEKVQRGEDYVVPIVMSTQREDVDKAGRSCVVWDCCMHPKVIVECIQNAGLRLLVIETCLELIESSSGLELSREYSLPKMLAKGTLERTLVRKRDLYGEGGDDEESVTQGIDDLARKVISSKSEPAPQPESGSKKQKAQKPLIQVLSSEDQGPEETTQELDYRVCKFDMLFSGEGSPPKYRVEISGASENDSLEMELQDETLKYRHLQIKIPGGGSRVQAFYVRDDQKIHAFIFA